MSDPIKTRKTIIFLIIFIILDIFVIYLAILPHLYKGIFDIETTGWTVFYAFIFYMMLGYFHYNLIQQDGFDWYDKSKTVLQMSLMMYGTYALTLASFVRNYKFPQAVADFSAGLGIMLVATHLVNPIFDSMCSSKIGRMILLL